MGVAIGLGCAEFPFSGAAAYWRWIDMCEAGGVDSIWQTDRIVGRQPFLESMTTMAALAGRTRRMRFGMNVVSLTFRDPVLLAKQCATIDMLSEGRLLLLRGRCLLLRGRRRCDARFRDHDTPRGANRLGRWPSRRRGPAYRVSV